MSRDSKPPGGRLLRKRRMRKKSPLSCQLPGHWTLIDEWIHEETMSIARAVLRNIDDQFLNDPVETR